MYAVVSLMCACLAVLWTMGGQNLGFSWLSSIFPRVLGATIHQWQLNAWNHFSLKKKIVLVLQHLRAGIPWLGGKVFICYFPSANNGELWLQGGEGIIQSYLCVGGGWEKVTSLLFSYPEPRYALPFPSHQRERKENSCGRWFKGRIKKEITGKVESYNRECLPPRFKTMQSDTKKYFLSHI